MTFEEQFHPCATGLHVMLLRDDAEHGPHVTVANYRFSSGQAARLAFEAVRVVAADDDSDEAIIDLMIDGDLHDGICVRRQMLNRVTTMLTAALDVAPLKKIGKREAALA